MDNIKVSLPKPNDTTGQSIKGFLRQLELCVHHLQKSVEEMEKNGDLSESTFILYRFPFLENKEQDADYNMKVHIDDLSGEMQELELEIATA